MKKSILEHHFEQQKSKKFTPKLLLLGVLITTANGVWAGIFDGATQSITGAMHSLSNMANGNAFAY